MKQLFAAILACLILSGCVSRNVPQPESDDLPSSSADEQHAESSQVEDLQKLSSENAMDASSQPEEESSDIQQQQQTSQPPQETEDWMLLLANEDHPIGTYTPDLMVVSQPYQMDVRVAPIVMQMIEDARNQGVELLICSAYRPYSSQERNFNNSVDRYLKQGYSKQDAVAMTANMIARPGHSEHQTGLAVDIVTPSYQVLDAGYAKTAAAKWLLENAADYGFILRYPEDKTHITRIGFEPWHYRYVGVKAAQEIMGQGLCLEEYLDMVPERS